MPPRNLPALLSVLSSYPRPPSCYGLSRGLLARSKLPGVLPAQAPCAHLIQLLLLQLSTQSPFLREPPFILLRVELCPLDSCWSHNPSTPDCERQVVELRSHCSRVTGVLIKRGLRTRGEGHVKTKTDIGVLCLLAEERRRGRASRPQQLRDSPGTDPLTCPSEGPNLPR